MNRHFLCFEYPWMFDLLWRLGLFFSSKGIWIIWHEHDTIRDVIFLIEGLGISVIYFTGLLEIGFRRMLCGWVIEITLYIELPTNKSIFSKLLNQDILKSYKKALKIL